MTTQLKTRKETLTFPYVPHLYVSHYQIFRRRKGETSFSFFVQIENPTTPQFVPLQVTGEDLIFDSSAIQLPEEAYVHSLYPPVVKVDGVVLDELAVTFSAPLKAIFFTDPSIFEEPERIVVECLKNLVSYHYTHAYPEEAPVEFEYQVELVFHSTYKMGTHYNLY